MDATKRNKETRGVESLAGKSQNVCRQKGFRLVDSKALFFSDDINNKYGYKTIQLVQFYNFCAMLT